MDDSQDEKWMRRALSLAKKGWACVNPNPMVGAVLVKNDQEIASGYHAFYGGPHAEIETLKKAGGKASGATLYITLEPCASWGKTPPCVSAIIHSRVKKVVIASEDPNPANHRKGCKALMNQGIRVKTGVLKREAMELNAGFFNLMLKGRPLITLKMAQSLDGKIATASGESKWITGKEARDYVQKLRSSHDAILVGYLTALQDNPSLTVRGVRSNSKKPWRIVIVKEGQLPRNHKIFKEDPLTIQVVSRAGLKRHQKEAGVFLVSRVTAGKIDLQDLVRKLAKLGICRLLVEGGGEIAASFVEQNLVDKISFFIAPKIIGGRSAKTSIEGLGVKKLTQALIIKQMHCRPIGHDWLFEGEL